MTVHANAALQLTHEHALGVVAGAIVEGPSRWVVRPVAEAVMEQDAGRTVSGVLGAIWQVRRTLSLDVGWRIARADGASLREFRAGFTWAVPLGSDADGRRAGPSSLPRWRPQA